MSTSLYLFYCLQITHCSSGTPTIEIRPPTENSGSAQADGNGAASNISLLIYPYERLKVVSSDPVTGIDVTKREVLLFVLI